jgi:glycine dehydrogenase subunit 2
MSIFHHSQEGQHAYSLASDEEFFEQEGQPEQKYCRAEAVGLPEISEIDLTRHFTNLARKTFSIDTHFYPLGSCTMKLNPRINEVCAKLPGFTRTHPLAQENLVQGNLQVIDELLEILCETCGMSAGSLGPNAGAQGEFVGLQMIAAYHRSRGDLDRDEVLIPDNAHGTNPATARLSGFKTRTIRSCPDGDLDLEHLQSLVSERTVGLMLTNPNTLGLFSSKIKTISKILHESGGLLFYDGANLNAILNIVRPGFMGFDVMHINLHKTFSTPHGGGGPGSGPILCNERLKPFLPVPRVVKDGDVYSLVEEDSSSIGRISTFHGNFGIYLRAYLYAKLHGKIGLRRIAEQAVLNANYLKHKLGKIFTVPYSQHCMHEFVIQADSFLHKGIKASDIAKRMLDYGVHAPTIYFPLIVKECMLFEPTESESKVTLDKFVEVMNKIVNEIHEDPEILKNAPYTCPVSRLDEVKAAKDLLLTQKVARS